MDKIAELLVAAGPYGVATAAILAMGYWYHNAILSTERSRLQETRDDKKQAQDIIIGNTEAMTKLCSAVDNCTETNRQVQQVVQRLLEK